MSLTPGATLGPYTLRAELGHGGMGVVYTAHDPRLDRQVAMKRSGSSSKAPGDRGSPPWQQTRQNAA